jgi:hypothetical protein
VLIKWTNIITKYNSIPLVRKNPDLTDYVTNQALNGVLKWWSKKKTSEQTLAPELCFITKSFRFQDRRYIFLTYPKPLEITQRNSSSRGNIQTVCFK